MPPPPLEPPRRNTGAGEIAAILLYILYTKSLLGVDFYTLQHDYVDRSLLGSRKTTQHIRYQREGAEGPVGGGGKADE